MGFRFGTRYIDMVIHHIDMGYGLMIWGDDSIDTVIFHINMGYIVALVVNDPLARTRACWPRSSRTCCGPSSPPTRYGGADIARRIAGCHLPQETRVKESASDDVTSNIRQATSDEKRAASRLKSEAEGSKCVG
jgi:hypothetical protein